MLTGLTTINIQGSGLADPDVVNLNGDGTSTVVAAMGTATPTITGGDLGTVNISGVGTVNLTNTNEAIIVAGTPSADTFVVTPTTANSAAIQANGVNPVVNAITTGALTVAPAGGGDSVTVNGTANGESINVFRAVAADTVSVAALKTIAIASADTANLVVATGLGTDTVNVTGTLGPILTVAGGQTPASDTLKVTNTATGTTTVTPGATNDSGTIVNGDGTIDFGGIKTVNITAATSTDTLTIKGTNGTSTITAAPIVAGNVAWVNSQAAVVFGGFGTLNLNGGFGTDAFNVSPVGLAGVTAINVNGAAGSTNSLTVFGSTAQETFGYTPTAAAAGSLTTAGSAMLMFANVPALTLNGDGGSDLLTINAPASSTTTYTPSSTPDSGTPRSTASPA